MFILKDRKIRNEKIFKDNMSQQSLLRAKLGREHNTLHRFVCNGCDGMQIYVLSCFYKTWCTKMVCAQCLWCDGNLCWAVYKDGTMQEGSAPTPTPISEERRRTRRPLLSIRLQTLWALCGLLSFKLKLQNVEQHLFWLGQTTGIRCCRCCLLISPLVFKISSKLQHVLWQGQHNSTDQNQRHGKLSASSLIFCRVVFRAPRIRRPV